MEALLPAGGLGRFQALAGHSDAAGFLELLAALPDRKIPYEALPLLVQVARRLSLPAALMRALALGSDPACPSSPRILLVQKLMERRDEATSLAAWHVLSANPEIFQTSSGRNAVRWLSMLRLRLPPGEARQQADQLLAQHRGSYPDPDELEGVELRERLRLLLDAEAWEAFCALAAEMPDRHLVGDAPAGLLTASLQVGAKDGVRRAVAKLGKELSRPGFRLGTAHRLILAGMWPEAWALLNVPELIGGDDEVRLRLMRMLMKLEAGAEPTLQQEVRALYRSMQAPVLPYEEAFPFPVIGPPRGPDLGVPSQRVIASRGTVTSQVALFEQLVARHERIVRAMGDGGSQAIRPPVRRLYRNVTIDGQGHIWDAEGRVAPTVHSPVPSGRTAAPGDAPRYSQAAVATDIPRNFFHWFAEGLPSLAWRLGGEGADMPILHNEATGKLIHETLGLLTDTAPPLVAITGSARVDEAHVARRGFELLYHWEFCGPLYERLVQRAMARCTTPQSGKLLYLSRRDVARRGIANELAVEEALEKLGFTSLTFQGRPLADQIRAFQEAEVVVTPHGAGLAHLAAARPGLKVFEIMPLEAGTERLRACYSLLSAIKGHRHALWLEQVHPVSQRWQVDLPAMLEALRRFMEETPVR